MTFRVIGTETCNYCKMVLKLLESEDHPVDYQILPVAEIKAMGFTTVPQVWHGDQHIGGYNDTVTYLAGL